MLAFSLEKNKLFVRTFYIYVVGLVSQLAAGPTLLFVVRYLGIHKLLKLERT